MANVYRLGGPAVRYAANRGLASRRRGKDYNQRKERRLARHWRSWERTVYFFKQFYLGCLAHASYLIGSDGEAAVVDPQRDVDQYLEEAERNGLKIKYVIETHLHAD